MCSMVCDAPLGISVGRAIKFLVQIKRKGVDLEDGDLDLAFYPTGSGGVMATPELQVTTYL